MRYGRCSWESKFSVAHWPKQSIVRTILCNATEIVHAPQKKHMAGAGSKSNTFCRSTFFASITSGFIHPYKRQYNHMHINYIYHTFTRIVFILRLNLILRFGRPKSSRCTQELMYFSYTGDNINLAALRLLWKWHILYSRVLICT